jgi:hypothetical protein
MTSMMIYFFLYRRVLFAKYYTILQEINELDLRGVVFMKVSIRLWYNI